MLQQLFSEESHHIECGTVIQATFTARGATTNCLSISLSSTKPPMHEFLKLSCQTLNQRIFSISQKCNHTHHLLSIFLPKEKKLYTFSEISSNSLHSKMVGVLASSSKESNKKSNTIHCHRDEHLATTGCKDSTATLGSSSRL